MEEEEVWEAESEDVGVVVIVHVTEFEEEKETVPVSDMEREGDGVTVWLAEKEAVTVSQVNSLLEVTNAAAETRNFPCRATRPGGLPPEFPSPVDPGK